MDSDIRLGLQGKDKLSTIVLRQWDIKRFSRLHREMSQFLPGEFISV